MATLGEQLVALAKTKIGKPYVWGAMGPNGFDCSGLVNWAAKQLGIKGLPRTSQEIRKAGTAVPLSSIAIGDLVTFTYVDRRGGNPGPGNHVAIYAGGGQVVQASGSKVNVSALDTKHIDRIVRLPGVAAGGVVQAGLDGVSSSGSTVRTVSTMQQAGYQAATKTSSFGVPVNPFKLPGWIAAGGADGASTEGGVMQAGVIDGLGGGGVSVPWDGVSTVILSTLFLIGGAALVVGGLVLAVRPAAAGGAS